MTSSIIEEKQQQQQQLAHPSPLSSFGVPVKFADHLFSTLLQDQLCQLIDLPEVRQLNLSKNEEDLQRLTSRMIELVKLLVSRHIKDNYKSIIQVLIYFKCDDEKLALTNKCLWNAFTDDLLSIQFENDSLKFVVIIYGLFG